MSYFFDSYAVIEIIRNNKNYEKYNSFPIITTTLNLTEIHYALLNELNQEAVNILINKINFQFLDITREIAIEAANFRFQNKKSKFSYADCIGYVAALKNNLIFLTGDKEFKDLKNVEFVK